MIKSAINNSWGYIPLPKKSRRLWSNFVGRCKITDSSFLFSESSGALYFLSEFWKPVIMPSFREHEESEDRGHIVPLLAVYGKVLCPLNTDVPWIASAAFSQCARLDPVFGPWKAREGWKDMCFCSVNSCILSIWTSLEYRDCFYFHIPCENAGPEETWGCLLSQGTKPWPVQSYS